MGQVAVVIKILPDTPENYESMKAEIQSKYNPKSMKEDELAFGLKALKVMLIMNDKAGAGNIEEEILKIKGVGQAQIEDMTLV